MSPVEVEQQVTYPMEVAMLGLPRTQGVRSLSKVGLSVIYVTFDDNVDLYFARTQVQQRMPLRRRATIGERGVRFNIGSYAAERRRASGFFRGAWSCDGGACGSRSKIPSRSMSKTESDVGGPASRTARGTENVPSPIASSMIRRGSPKTSPTEYTCWPETATSAATNPSPVPAVPAPGDCTVTYVVADADRPNPSDTVNVNA